MVHVETRVIEGKKVSDTVENFECHNLLDRVHKVSDLLETIAKTKGEGRVSEEYKILFDDALRVLGDRLHAIRRQVTH